MSVYNEDLPQVGMTTERAAQVLVIGALVALVAIKFGFRGVNVGGVSIGVK